jgi:putative ABC transport system permease protein
MVKHLGALTRAVRNISRRKMRALLVIIALGFSMAIMVSIPAGIVANQASAQTITENFNTTMVSMQEEINQTATLIQCQTSFGSGMFPGRSSGTFPFGSRQQDTISETIVDEVYSIEGVKEVVPFLEASSNDTTTETINGPGGREFTISRPLYTITGVCLNSSLVEEYSTLPTNITSGRNLREGDSGVLLASQNLTDYFGVGVGGEAEINGVSFTVVGIYEQATQSSTGTRTVYMNLTDAQTITGLTGNVSRLDVYAEDASDVEGIATAIKAAYSDLQVTTYNDRLSQIQNMQTNYEATLTNAQSTLSQTQAIATQEIIVAVMATSLIVLFVMLYTVRERTKEIGTLKAIGFSSWNVMSQFMLEGTLLTLVAGVVGIAIGSVGAPVLSNLLLPSLSSSLFGSRGSFQGNILDANPTAAASGSSSATLNPQLMLLALGAAVLLGAIGSLYPAWRASRTKPAEAMRYE